MGIKIEGMKVIDDLPPSKMSEIMSASTAAPATTTGTAPTATTTAAPTTATTAPATTQSSVVKGKELKYNAV